MYKFVIFFADNKGESELLKSSKTLKLLEKGSFRPKT